MRALVALLLAILLAGCATIREGDGAGAGRFVEWQGVEADGLPTQRVTIWLPPEYAAQPDRRFPVLYMWDGQNLFNPALTHYGKAWQVDDVLMEMVASDEAVPHIVVGLWSPPGKDRYRTYLPQPAADAANGALAASVQEMAGAPVASQRNLEWLADELKPRVDRSFRTLTSPDSTTVVGASMGGVMTCYSIVERPDVFGKAGCVSSHWPIADPDLAIADRSQVDAIWGTWLASSLGEPDGRRIWMDHGTATLDAYYPPFQSDITAHFRKLGWREGRDFTSRAYPGAEHDEIAWNARLPEMLRWLWREE